MKCPCHSQKPYESCCKPFHTNASLPPSPLELMRSRYSAYALDLADYIMDTTHKKNPAYQLNRTLWANSIHTFCRTTSFLNLSIINASSDQNNGFVHFKAYLRSIQGSDLSFEEQSLFIRENGKWFYLSGERSQ